MSIDLFYDFMGERKSQVIVLKVIDDQYQIVWHYMEIEGTEKNAISISNRLTNDEFETLYDKISVMFREKNIPDFILQLFDEQIKSYSDE